MAGGWKVGKGGKKVRVTPKKKRQQIGAGRNAKGEWKKRRSLAARLGIEGVPAYGR